MAKILRERDNRQAERDVFCPHQLKSTEFEKTIVFVCFDHVVLDDYFGARVNGFVRTSVCVYTRRRNTVFVWRIRGVRRTDRTEIVTRDVSFSYRLSSTRRWTVFDNRIVCFYTDGRGGGESWTDSAKLSGPYSTARSSGSNADCNT